MTEGEGDEVDLLGLRSAVWKHGGWSGAVGGGRLELGDESLASRR